MTDTVSTSKLPCEFLTREDFAGLMQYSLRTVDEIIGSGRIDVHRHGRAVRIPVEAYLRFRATGMHEGGNVERRELSADETGKLKRLLAPLLGELVESRLAALERGAGEVAREVLA